MRKTLLWIQVILMIAFAKTRLHAAHKSDKLSNVTQDEVDLLEEKTFFNQAIYTLAHPGNKPQFRNKLKDRKGTSTSEAAESEEDYAHKRFNPLIPPPPNLTLPKTFKRITAKAKGHFHHIVPEEGPEVVNKLIHKHAKPSTDLVFVIDQTGSMVDDVERIQEEVGDELVKYKDTENFRVGATTYSNVKTGGEVGFTYHDLEADHSYLPGFLRNIQIMGGVEDMFGGVVKTIRLINWQNGSRRVMVVITDDYPETDPRETDFTEDEMLEIVKQAKVELNVILIG